MVNPKDRQEGQWNLARRHNGQASVRTSAPALGTDLVRPEGQLTLAESRRPAGQANKNHS